MTNQKLYDLVEKAESKDAVAIEEIFNDVISERISERLEEKKEGIFSDSLIEDFAGIKHSGGPLDGKTDKRYSLNKEYDGHSTSRYVARFGGDYLGSHETREGAKDIAQKHKDYRDRLHAGIRESISNEAEAMGYDLTEDQLDELTEQAFDEISKEKLNEAFHPLDAHRILSQNGGRDANFFSLSSSHVNGLAKAAKDHGYRGSRSSGKSVARAFHDHLNSRADKFVDHEGNFKPGMRDKFNESVDLDESDKNKRDIFVDGKYHSSTIQSKSHSEAKQKFLKAYPQHQGKKIQVVKANESTDYEGIDLEEGRKQPADEDSAHELVLHATNDHHLYKHSATPIIDNLKRKVKSGKYDHEKATKLWRYHADRAAEHYKKEYGNAHFSPATRDMAAKHLRDHYDEDVRGTHHVNESTEISELSKKTLGSYVKKATTNVGDKNYIAGHRYGKLAGKDRKYDADNHANNLITAAQKRKKNINKAIDKITKENAEAMGLDLSEDQLSELSQKTMEKYSSANMRRMGKAFKDNDEVNKEKSKKGLKLVSKRMLGVKESEDLEELSQGTKTNYMRNASNNLDHNLDKFKGGDKSSSTMKRIVNRSKGIDRAMPKTSK